MKTQISRDPYQPDKRYSGVYQQQGRMLTDADWNALAEIVKRRLDEALADVIGSGAPRGPGLRVTSGPQFSGFRLYADGVPAEVRPERPGEAFDYGNQADFPTPPPLPENQEYVLYADVWERSVDSLEDTGDWTADHLLDPALHGADTTTRTQTMAQIKWCPPFAAFPLPEDRETNPPIGDSLLTVELRAGQAGGSDPCDPCAQEVAVSRRIGNYLFRLEVHHVEGGGFGAPPTGVILKWSSENGAEQHRVGNEPEDFNTGSYVYEFYNDRTEKHLGVHLAEGFEPARGDLHATWPATPPAGFDRVRRWDGYAVFDLSSGGLLWSLAEAGGDVQVEDGRDIVLSLPALTVTLDPRSFVAGDYWLAPVRESVHQAGTTVLAQAPPHGILHHYLRLASVSANGGVEAPGTDLKQSLSFPPLTDLQAQDVDYETACPAGLFNPPENFDTVQKALDRLCQLSAEDIHFTKPCDTSLYTGVPERNLRTVADALRLLCDIEARHVEYVPEGDCTLLAGLATVQQALNRLCKLVAADIPFTPPNNCTLLQGTVNIDQALARVCGIKAENVGYTAHAGCAALNPNIQTVKDALDTLCARPAGGGGGGGCHSTVGDEGEFKTLAEAIEDSLGEQKKDLCFCLLPGKHGMASPLTIDNRVNHITLSGCGPGSLLIVSENLTFSGVLSVRFENLSLEIDPDRQIVVEGGNEVALERVLAAGPARDPDSPSPVTLHAESSIRVAESELRFWLFGGISRISDIFVPVGEDLNELFKQRRDEVFEAAVPRVAESLARLPQEERSRIALAIADAIFSEPPRFSQQETFSLSRLRDLLRISPAPDAAALTEALGEVREAAIRSHPALALVLSPWPGGVHPILKRFKQISEILTPVRRELGELFALSPGTIFKAQTSRVAANIARLARTTRNTLANAIANTEGQWRVLSEEEISSLRRFIEVIRTPEPAVDDIATSLVDIGTDAVRSASTYRFRDATLVDNRISGLVSFYGPPGGDLTRDEMTALSERFKTEDIGLEPSGGRISVTRNEVSRLVLGDWQILQLKALVAPTTNGSPNRVDGVYLAAFVTQNRFTSGLNRVHAKDARLTDNIFEPVDPDLGAVIADIANYVGNGSVEDDTFHLSNVTRRHNGQTRDDLNVLFFNF